MIIVTGATGQLGNAIVHKLIAQSGAGSVRAICRDPEKAADLAKLGVNIRRADFAEPDTLTKAFEGARQILLVSSNARSYGGDPLTQHATVIRAAKHAGATRIVYTSQIASSATSAFSAARDHAATEQMLADSGLAWTALRNGFYAKSGIMIMSEAFKTGVLETTQDGKFSWVSHDDLASAAAVILGNEGRFEGPTPPLTGSEALDFGDMAHIAADVMGKPFIRTIITDDEMRANVAARGAPPSAANMVLGLFSAAHAGEFGTVDPLLEELIGRPPQRMKQLMMNYLAN